MKIITSKSLWVSSSFTEKFGSEDIKSTKDVPQFKTLLRDMLDSEIQRELGVGASTLEDIVAFLKNPPEGCDDGYWNIFYLEHEGQVVPVSVRWLSDDREWDVRGWGFDDRRWNAGSRVFFRNSAVGTSGATLESLPLELVINGFMYKRV